MELMNHILQICALLGIVIEITPIKLSPLRWIGKRINRSLSDKIDRIEQDLQEHIVDEWRTYILDFQNSCLNKRRHTREEFKRVYGICDKYEKYIEKRNLKNSEIEDAMSYIRTVYKNCLENGEFLLREDKENEQRRFD